MAGASASTTAGAIRDRVIALVEGLTPVPIAGSKFRRYRNEGGADFEAWANANPAGAWRRFQVRDSGTVELPEVSNLDVDRRYLTLTVLVAYPIDARAGADQALERDDAMDADFHTIDYSIGIYGRANFTVSGGHDATPLGAVRELPLRGTACDLLAIAARYEYVRSTS